MTPGDHGGKRSGSGRPKELKRPKKVLITLEEHHLRMLRKYSKAHGLRGRSEAVRHILDNLERSE